MCSSLTSLLVGVLCLVQADRSQSFTFYAKESSFYRPDGNRCQFLEDDSSLSTLLLVSKQTRTRSQPMFLASSKCNDDEKGVDDTLVNANAIVTSQDAEELRAKTKKEFSVKRGFKKLVEKLASWSLLDYQWRSKVFKENQAERQMEETLARMRGVDTGYVRPMDASGDNLGPLGKAEREAVQWLSNVIEEEGRRAALVVERGGDLVRPTAMEGDLTGMPLARMEAAAVEFWQRLRTSETTRFRENKRPMETPQHPLGDAEAAMVALAQAEVFRLRQSVARGESVRPIDVPGPLGELERKIGEVYRAELRRTNLKKRRPMDVGGPLGEAEVKALGALDELVAEESGRLEAMRRFALDKRPMESQPQDPLGLTEKLFVNLFRAPMLLITTIQRTMELWKSEVIALKSADATELLPAAVNQTVSMDEDNVFQ